MAKKSCGKLLYDFLHKCNAQVNFHVFYSMFNKEIDFFDILEQNNDILCDELIEFHKVTDQGRVATSKKYFVHLKDLGLGYVVNKRCWFFPQNMKVKCTMHKRNYKLLEESLAFAVLNF